MGVARARQCVAGLLIAMLVAGNSRAAGIDNPKSGPAPPSAAKAIGSLENATRVALVIGNTSYRHLAPLHNAVTDARDVCEALTRLNFQATCFYNLATRREFREVVLGFFSQVNRKHTVVFYFAGHGFQVEGENYLMPTEIDPRTVADVEEDGISLSYLKRQIELSGSGPNLVILDACSDPPFQGTSRPLARGLARADPPEESILVYASAPNQSALDDAGKNGLFAKHLLAHMENTGISVEQLLAVVAEAVDKEARQLQVTQRPFRSSSLTQRFCLAGCDDPDENRQQIMRQLQRVQAELDERSVKDGKREAEVLAMRTADAEREARIAALESEIGARDHKLAELQHRMETLLQDSTGAERTSRELQETKAELQVLEQERLAGLARLQQQNAVRQRELTDLRDAEAKLQALRQEIDGYQAVVRDLQTRIRALSSRPPDPASRPPRVIVPSL